MSSLSEALRQLRLPDERNQELLVAAADALDRAEAANARDHQSTLQMIQSIGDIFREEKAAWQVERARHDKAMGEVIRERDECRAMLDRQQRAAFDHPVFAFLLGEGQLHGVDFGERAPRAVGKWWWRKDLRAALSATQPEQPKAESRVGTNTGHGHVWARPDGVKMRCGGPGLCDTCSKDKAHATQPEQGGRDAD